MATTNLNIRETEVERVPLLLHPPTVSDAGGVNGTAVDMHNLPFNFDVLVSVGTVANVDSAFIYIEESPSGTGNWKQIALVGRYATSNAVSCKKLRRTKRYIRSRVAVEFVQPGSPVTVSFPSSVIALV